MYGSVNQQYPIEREIFGPSSTTLTKLKILNPRESSYHPLTKAGEELHGGFLLLMGCYSGPLFFLRKYTFSVSVFQIFLFSSLLSYASSFLVLFVFVVFQSDLSPSPSPQAIINPDWQDMFVLIQSSQESRGHQGFSAVYRKAQEGRVPEQERLITANVEADQQHIETIINFACSFMWASILDTTPPQPHITLL